ncbi:hypothetical protein EVAR_31656_1 [Eumeta japonica]|uniref:Uncharacterized protein n=1 Tax=Eumeta variegata TaxID=151549 RepID=A0A4C1W0X8_EUMVA|nr:hypothetical protein EVAR_31656_1 [Eumeta japonica]
MSPNPKRDLRFNGPSARWPTACPRSEERYVLAPDHTSLLLSNALAHKGVCGSEGPGSPSVGGRIRRVYVTARARARSAISFFHFLASWKKVWKLKGFGNPPTESTIYDDGDDNGTNVEYTTPDSGESPQVIIQEAKRMHSR